MRSTLTLSILAVCLAVGTLCGMIASTPAGADTVTDWNGYASTAIVATAAQPPPSAVLSFAMVQGAVYDAVNAIDHSHRAYLHQPPARRSDSKDAAAATAAYRVLVGLFPAHQGTLQPLYDASLAGVTDTPPGAKAGGIAAGIAAATSMLAARKNDGRFGPFTPVFGTTPGVYRPTPPGFAPDPAPWVRNVQPFVVPNIELLRTQPPNTLTSRAYARDLNESKTSARSTARPGPRTRPPPRPSGKTMPSRSATAPRAHSPRAAICKITINATSNKTATTRTYRHLSDALQEHINARVWAGIHFRTADLQGARLGQKVAHYLHNHDLQPVR